MDGRTWSASATSAPPRDRPAAIEQRPLGDCLAVSFRCMFKPIVRDGTTFSIPTRSCHGVRKKRMVCQTSIRTLLLATNMQPSAMSCPSFLSLFVFCTQCRAKAPLKEDLQLVLHERNESATGGLVSPTGHGFEFKRRHGSRHRVGGRSCVTFNPASGSSVTEVVVCSKLFQLEAPVLAAACRGCWTLVADGGHAGQDGLEHRPEVRPSDSHAGTMTSPFAQLC